MSSVRDLCDNYLSRYEDIQREYVQIAAARHEESQELFARLDALSQQQAADLLVAARGVGFKKARDALQSHALHRDVLLQSAFIRHALLKPRGYAGDMELMRMICEETEVGATLFARQLNRVYLQLPASQAVRDRVHMLGHVIDRLPAASHVLNLACGPALEVQRHFQQRPNSTLSFDLIDHDVQTLAYLGTRLQRPNVTLWHGNAFALMAGNFRAERLDTDVAGQGHRTSGHVVALTGRYDLIYAAGLYDYLPDTTKERPGAADLTLRLFRLLKPNGLLVVGNYLKPSQTSLHHARHQLMMELYSRWCLRYRNLDQVRGFARTLPTREFDLEFFDEKLRPLYSTRHSAIAFAHIRRRP